MMRILAKFPGLIHFHRQNLVYGSIDQHIYQSLDGGSHWSAVITLPIKWRWKLVQIIPLGRRLFRAGIRHLIPEGDHLVIFGYGLIYHYHLKTGTLSPPSRIIGSRPFTVCFTARFLYYGEYWRNPNRKAIRVLRSMDHGVSWEPVYEFNNIRHIHGIFYDPEYPAIWVTTGDEDHESAIWMTTDHFKTIKKIHGGSQQFRVVSLIFTPEFVYFGSDTGRMDNFIYRFQRSTGAVEKLQAVNGPIFYGAKTGFTLLFSTVCEPSKNNPTKYMTVWRSDNGKDWFSWLCFKKDGWPRKWFQYGQIMFPAGSGAVGEVWLSATTASGFKGSIKLAVPKIQKGGVL